MSDSSEMAIVRERRIALVAERKKLEAELADVNHKIRGNRLPSDMYRRLLNRQHKLGQDMRKLDVSLSETKGALAKMERARDEAQPIPRDVWVDDAGMAGEVVLLLSKWRQFAEDRTRISSIRIVAAEVASDLESLLKHTVRQ